MYNLSFSKREIEVLYYLLNNALSNIQSRDKADQDGYDREAVKLAKETKEYIDGMIYNK